MLVGRDLVLYTGFEGLICRYSALLCEKEPFKSAKEPFKSAKEPFKYKRALILRLVLLGAFIDSLDTRPF